MVALSCSYASYSSLCILCGTHQYPRSRAPSFSRHHERCRQVWVKIDTTEIIHGKVASREIADVLAWARAHRDMLAAKFEELQQ